MALTDKEKKELEQLESEVGGLTAEEARELDQLEAEASQQGTEAGEGSSFGDQAAAAVQGFGQSATFGFLPQLQAGAEIAAEKVGGVFGVGPEAERERLEAQGITLPPEQTFSERAQSFAQGSQRLQEQNPGSFLAGELAGFAVPGAGAAKVAKSLPRAARAIQSGSRGARVAKGAGALAAGGGVQGAIETPLAEQAEGNLLDVQGRIDRAATGAILGPAAFGFGKAIAAAPKKLLSVFGGVRTDIIDKYLANPDAIKDAEKLGREGVEKIIDDAVAPIKFDLDSATTTLTKAKELMKDVENTLIGEFKNEKRLAAQIFREREKQLDKAFARGVKELEDIPPPTNLSGQVGETLEDLKKQLIEGSEEATDILARNLREPIDVSTAYDAIDSSIAQLNIPGTNKPIPDMEDLVDQLANLKEKFMQVPEMNGPQIKAFIKAIDRKIDISDVAGSFDHPINIARKKVRRALDDILKSTDPEYAQQMLKVREDAALLEGARRVFGDPTRRLNKLRLIDKDGNVTDREMLNLLGQRMGQDFEGQVDNFISVKGQIKDLKNRAVDSPARQQFIKELPEFRDVQEAREALDAVDFLDAQDLRNKVAEDIRAQNAREALDAAQERFDMAKQAADDVRGFLDGGSERKINSMMKLMSGGNQTGTALRAEFERMSKLADNDLENLIDSVRVSEVFDQEFTRGSRNVNLWATMAAASNLLVTGDFMASGAGALTGAGIGAMIDKFGPRATKQVLSFVSNTNGMMTRHKLSTAALDPEIKNDLLEMFDQSILRGIAQTEVISIAPEDIELTRKDIQARPDLSNIDKAKMVNSLNRDGTIEQPAKFMGKPASVEEARRKANE